MPVVVQIFDKVVDVPVVQVVQFIDGVNVPVIMQRQVRVSSTVEVPQIQFTARVVDIPVVQQRRVHSFQQCWVWRR